MAYLRLLLVLLWSFVLAPAFWMGTMAEPALAQDLELTQDLLEDWERTAARAEEAVANARASTPAFEALRAHLATWRDTFQDAQQANARTIQTVRRQLDALGPPPAEDATESEEIAAERQVLNQRLADLEAPVKTAELAYNRADGLIQAIDKIIRDRQAEALLEFGPTPLNPAHWVRTATALRQTAEHIHGEFVVAWSNDLQQKATKEALPAVIVLAIVGSILVVRGRRWSRLIMLRVLGDDPGAGRWIAGFLLSLGSALLPLLGVLLLISAVYATGLVGLLSDRILQAVVPATFIFVFARWLAMRVFPAVEARALPLVLSEDQRQSGRRYGAALGLVAGLHFLLKQMTGHDAFSDQVIVTLLFPLLLIAALMLLRIAWLLRAHCDNTLEGNDDQNYRTRLIRVLVLVLIAVSVISPILAAVGYFKLAQFILFPTLMTLQLLAFLLVLQRVVIEVYVLITGNRDGASDSLIPILIGFAMVVLSLPLLALIWGARQTDLTELWSQMLKGFDIGGLRLSPTVFITFAIVFVIGYTATRLLQGALRNTILPKTKIDPGGQVAIVSGLGYIGIFLAAVIAITSAGIDLSSIAIVAGALSVGIGFGLQTIVSNFVSGIILLIERPISNGDWIEVGGVHGNVRNISVRSTVIETFDRSQVIVPNSDLVSGRVTNYTRGRTVGRVIVPVGVAYGTDTRKVEKILREIAEDHPMVLLSTPPAVVFQGFGADSMDFEIRAILRDVNWVLSVKSDMNHAIAKRFAEEGVEIPFAQRDVWIRNPETLPGATSVSEASLSATDVAHPIVEEMGDPDTDGDAGDK